MPNYSTRMNIEKPLSTENVTRALFLRQIDRIDEKAAILNDTGKLDGEQVDLSLIPVADANNHFTATKLDGVLDELFTFADNGRTGIASVVGPPAASTDPFPTLASKIQAAKDTMATNLTAKNVPSVGTETLQALAEKISGAVSYEFASGSVTGLANETNVNYKVTLPRQPKMVYVTQSFDGASVVPRVLHFPEASIMYSTLVTINADGFTLKNTAFPGFDWTVMY